MAVARQVVANAAAALAFLIDDLLDDDDRDETLWEKITVNVDEYCRMGDPSFRWHFRLRKPFFEILLQEVGNHLLAVGRLRRERRPLAHMLLMVLWILATPDSFRSVALRFGVYKSELHRHYVTIIVALREMSEVYITWPNERERNTMQGACEQISEFPGVVGIMDGSHVSIIAPQEDKAAHRNYHHGYSIKVQAVVDHNYVVRDVYIGEAGSLHDARVFRRSPLCRNILSRGDMFSPGQHIIADSAYMLLDRVLITFINNGHLTPQQVNFNRRLSRIRARVEHTFAHVDSLWRRMTALPNTNMEYAVDHVAASIVLHNFKIIKGQELINRIGGDDRERDNAREEEDDYDDPLFQGNQDDLDNQGIQDFIPDPHVPQQNLAERLEIAQMIGDQKRWDICNRLPFP